MRRARARKRSSRRGKSGAKNLLEEADEAAKIDIPLREVAQDRQPYS